MRKLIVYVDHDRKRIEETREAGWDGVFTEWTEDPCFFRDADYIRSSGLIHQSVHAPFGDVYRLWEDPGEGGEREVERQITCLTQTASIGVDLVILHGIIGMERCAPTALGVERFGRIAGAAGRLGIRIALENTEGEIYLETLMKALKGEKHVGFCLDTGHELCYNYGHDLLALYGDRLFGTHCNDNMGMTGQKLTWLDDSHMLPYDGKVDWDALAIRLNKIGYRGPLTFEFVKENRPGRHTNDRYEAMSYQEYIALAWERAGKFAMELEKVSQTSATDPERRSKQ